MRAAISECGQERLCQPVPQANVSSTREAVRVIEGLGGRMKKSATQSGVNVTDVSLFGTSVTDEDLRSLRYFSELQTLYLHNTNVSDTGLKHLKKLPSLNVLVLGDCITDEGLKDIMEMRQLTYLCVLSKCLTLETIERLRLELPHCEIDI